MFSRFPSSAPFGGRLTLAVCVLLAVGGCEREKRDTHPDQPSTASSVSPTALRAGGEPQPVPKDPAAAQYEDNAFFISEGKRYYEWYNCYGCHAAGGGDIGPPLMDDRWIYGGEIEQIRATIVEGRPNGMPSFRGRIPDAQIWQIAGFVRSMAGNIDKDVAPSRGDELQSGPPKNQTPPTPPVPSAPPGGPPR
jgi:cytochrome c oxidase cbb3-type subunit III